MAAEEIDASCRQLIQDHFAWMKTTSGKACRCPRVFGDLAGCVPRGSFDAPACFTEKAFDIDEAPLRQYQHCYTHNRKCKLFGPDTNCDLEVAGLPCPDFSQCGKQLMEEGPTAHIFICHAKRHVEKETPLVVIENTKDRTSCVRALVWLWV